MEAVRIINTVLCPISAILTDGGQTLKQPTNQPTITTCIA